jgi:hypothetical protein
MDRKIIKDRRRIRSFNSEADYHGAWKLSLKFANYLLVSIDKDDLYDKCILYHSQYINELRNNGYNIDKNYTQIWNTMINTVLKGGNMKSSVRLLHQTSVQRNN